MRVGSRLACLLSHPLLASLRPVVCHGSRKNRADRLSQVVFLGWHLPEFGQWWALEGGERPRYFPSLLCHPWQLPHRQHLLLALLPPSADGSGLGFQKKHLGLGSRVTRHGSSFLLLLTSVCPSFPCLPSQLFHYLYNPCLTDPLLLTMLGGFYFPH